MPCRFHSSSVVVSKRFKCLDVNARGEKGNGGSSNQTALIDRGSDERGKQRMRLERPRFELGMKLNADEPGMILILDHLGQQPVRRHAGKAHAVLLKAVLVAGIDLVAVAVAL